MPPSWRMDVLFIAFLVKTNGVRCIMKNECVLHCWNRVYCITKNVQPFLSHSWLSNYQQEHYFVKKGIWHMIHRAKSLRTPALCWFMNHIYREMITKSIIIRLVCKSHIIQWEKLMMMVVHKAHVIHRVTIIKTRGHHLVVMLQNVSFDISKPLDVIYCLNVCWSSGF